MMGIKIEVFFFIFIEIGFLVDLIVELEKVFDNRKIICNKVGLGIEIID